MGMKARIVIYDELLIIDETEVSYCDLGNLEALTASFLRSTPGAEIAEAYIGGGKLKYRLQLTRKGKVKRLSIHPNWGGARPGAGRKPIGGKALSIKIAFRVDQDTFDFLQTLLTKKGKFVRDAIREKRERDYR